MKDSLHNNAFSVLGKHILYIDALFNQASIHIFVLVGLGIVKGGLAAHSPPDIRKSLNPSAHKIRISALIHPQSDNIYVTNASLVANLYMYVAHVSLLHKKGR